MSDRTVTKVVLKLFISPHKPFVSFYRTVTKVVLKPIYFAMTMNRRLIEQ